MNQKAIGRRQFSVGLGAAALGGFNLAQAQGEGRIVLGQSAPFTGPSAQLGIQFNLGAKLFFDRSMPRAAWAGARWKSAPWTTATSPTAAPKTPES
jgi:hypothetical protein